MQRPALPTITAYFQLLSSTTVFLLFYRMHVAGRFATAPLLLGSSLPVNVQWIWLGIGAAANVTIALGLMRGYRWARSGLYVSTVANALLAAMTSHSTWSWQLLGIAMAAIPCVMAAISARQVVQKRAGVNRTPWEAVRYVAGMSLYWAAAFVMFVVLTSMFVGGSDRNATGGENNGLFIAFALVIMLAGAALMGKWAGATREAALLLISLSSFLIVYCVWEFLCFRLATPRSDWHFQWDQTWAWLMMLGMGGFALMAAADRMQTK
ncbi:hypothetical protein [Trinickia fusca]|uniref:Uncharacterized protein n=1 Tax=Trinickia fusca TaxID=2419777 RepID=A0A494XEQ2_9BURK|nr:hypothetical protein [Trinickia fusca]RKP48141.1 hypothetical protein D7S89_12385 [Trinickia fusca]